MVLVAAERFVFRGEGLSLSPLPVSLSSTVPEGEGAPVVPGLVSCPSISKQQLKQHCDRNGDSDQGEGRHKEVLEHTGVNTALLSAYVVLHLYATCD